MNTATLQFQAKLNLLGYSLALDGVLGPKTSSAISEFQRSKSIPVTGIPDKLTWAFLREGDFLKDNKKYFEVPVNVAKPIDAKKEEYKTVANIYNRWGNLIEVVASNLFVEPEVAFAVFAVETTGDAFSQLGPIIRFETHIFERYTSSVDYNFYEYFRYDAAKPWKGQEYKVNGTWKQLHLHPSLYGLETAQQREWEAFNIAASIDKQAAMLSTSIGLPQIMGFNHRYIGYLSSVEDMFMCFSQQAHYHILGFFDFILSEPDNSLLISLKTKDFLSFAKKYNGSGQASFYASKIEEQYLISLSLLEEKNGHHS